MEDFEAVYQERMLDTEMLYHQERYIAAMHFGGISIECLLKAMIVDFHNLTEWKTDSTHPGHTIHNPGHDLIKAIRTINQLWSNVQRNPQVLTWLNQVEYPFIEHYIDLRYLGNEPDEKRHKEWFEAYTKLKIWLVKQSTFLGKLK
ncbi:MAG: hypothetical protein ACTSXO_01960 [Candidatus Heimdallarchaeota archaeon]|jgi:hypothetical protein